MSWFDPSGFASLAKSALKEAQKTIDKALDINDEESLKSIDAAPKRSGDINTDSFFSTWDIQSSPASLVKKATKMTNSTSTWGSFTGSFFENQTKDEGGNESKEPVDGKELVSNQPKKSLSLDLSHLSSGRKSSPTPKEERPADLQLERGSPPPQGEDEGTEPDGAQIREEIKNFPQVEVVLRRREPKVAANRLSVISSESDRRSTESCDVVSSTPDSDPNTLSSSSSVARLRQSGSFESVEVLTSPSSVDILGSQSSELKSCDSVSPTEGDGVEVIPEDEDSVSVEDSYTSVSDTTLTVTVLDPAMLKSTSSLDASLTEPASPRESRSISGPGEPGRSRVGGQHLYPPASSEVEGGCSGGTKETAGGVSQLARLHESKSPPSQAKPPGSSTQVEVLHSSTRIDFKDVVTQAPRPSGGRLSESLSDTEGAQVETSSCEDGTLMGSSAEEVALAGGLVAARGTTPTVCKVLADAITETSFRDQSPISSEKSDLVKVISIGSSEHTSGDEFETTTSSDIEVISSPTPNGSSAASRQSPSKSAHKSVNIAKILTGKVKGHHREPSETSSGGSDECSEVDRLLKKIAEMTEILEARESKLIDLSRINADLQESNCELKSQLEKEKESQEMKNLSEEFTQRVAALEKKFQQAIREKEALRKQLESAKVAAAEREEEMNKDQLIAELRSEGEKLSKTQLTLNNAIKKLRASEKENVKTIAHLRDELSSVSGELERSKKAMSVKEEMERSQIEAVHQLTKANSLLEKELTLAKSNISSLTSTLVSTQKEVDEKETALRQLEERLEREKSELESLARTELVTELEASQRQVLSLQSALEDMRRQILHLQEEHSKAEAGFVRERRELLGRAEAAERRAESETESLTQATLPLARQIQTLTEQHGAARAAWEAREAQLNATIGELESRVASLSARERGAREGYEASAALTASLQDKVSSLTQQNEALLAELDSMKGSLEKMKLLKNSESKKYQQEKERLTGELEAKRRELTSYKELLSIEKAALDAEKRKSLALQEQLRTSRAQVSPQLASPRSSPTLSIGRASMSDSFSSNIWPNLNDDLLETGSNSGRSFDILRPVNNPSFLENLQSQLKLRDGDIQQLQWEVARLESERNSLRDEVSALSAQVEELTAQLASHSLLKTQYDALLQMYGEKLEESQELRMDLQDVKEMYKAQIDELLKRESGPSTQPPPASS